MVLSKGYEKYKAQEVNTANPMTLVIMLYSGCIKQIKLAEIAIEKKKYSDANISFKKAEDILMELMMSLDLKYDISKNLMAIYSFIYDELVKMNISKNTETLEPVVKILSDLRDAWSAIEKEYKPVELVD
jgi:flagellar secretion chaperone FliS